MRSPVKWAVLNDYDRTANLENPRAGAGLSADASVRSSLDSKNTATENESLLWGTFGHNITEDGLIDTHSNIRVGGIYKSNDSDIEISSLSKPLPHDLPTGQKDIILAMAAHYGQIDRYDRLRRPRMVGSELQCVIRGIFHNTPFARYWADRDELGDDKGKGAIITAVHARHIMNNDLLRVENVHNCHLPYMIYYPTWASPNTYATLAKMLPSMVPQIARAFIIMNQQECYDDFEIVPDTWLIAEAKASPNLYFLNHLKERVNELGIDLEKGDSVTHHWKMYTRADAMESSGCLHEDELSRLYIIDEVYGPPGPYDPGYLADVSAIEQFLSSPLSAHLKSKG